MKKIFSSDNPVIAFFYTAADLVIANVLTFLCCLPVVTIGAAMAANHHAMQGIVYKTGGSLVRTYFRKFCEYFKHATIVWVVQVLVLAGLGVNMYLVLIYFDETFRNVLLVLMAVFALLVLMIDAVMMPLIARYENKLSEHFHNAVILGTRKFFLTLILVVLKLAPVIFAVAAPTAFIASIPFWLFAGLSLMTLLSNLLLKRTFLSLEEQRDAQLDQAEA